MAPPKSTSTAKSRSSISTNTLPTNSFKSSKPSLTTSNKSKAVIKSVGTTNNTKSKTIVISDDDNTTHSRPLPSSDPLLQIQNQVISPLSPSSSPLSLSTIKLLPTYKSLLKQSLKEMGKPTHGKLNEIEVILKVFDSTEAWGPVCNISRLMRFERAKRMGLNVPGVIGEILNSPECKEKKEWTESPFKV